MSVFSSRADTNLHHYAHGRDIASSDKQRLARRNGIQLPVVFLPWIVGLVLAAAWYFATASGRVNALILPAPIDVFHALVDGFSSGIYLQNTLVTVQESVFGFLLAVAVALPLGYGLAKSRLLATTFQPYLAAGQAIPAIVIAPLLVLWLGYGMLPTMLVCMLVVLFPLIINTVFGIQSIEPALTDAARVEGAAGWSMLAHIEFPLALPAILAAVRTCFTLSITGALVGEFVGGGDQGLGALILIAKNQYNMPLMFATLVVLGVLAAAYYGSTWLLIKLANAIYY
ncbi:MAG TPA: ABC transporter permease [Ktedonobacteraceae bacterium]|jgi:NitT/TauT family transport system permease protein